MLRVCQRLAAIVQNVERLLLLVTYGRLQNYYRVQLNAVLLSLA